MASLAVLLSACLSPAFDLSVDRNELVVDVVKDWRWLLLEVALTSER